jgi:hypothetical protein
MGSGTGRLHSTQHKSDFPQLNTNHHERLKHNRSLRKSRSRHRRRNGHVSTYIIPDDPRNAHDTLRGLMIAQGLASSGAKVYITGRRVDVLEKAAAAYQGKGSIVA